MVGVGDLVGVSPHHGFALGICKAVEPASKSLELSMVWISNSR